MNKTKYENFTNEKLLNYRYVKHRSEVNKVIHVFNQKLRSRSKYPLTLVTY